MEPRLDYGKASPNAIRSMVALQRGVTQCEVEDTLLELVRFRASQLNGCAYCLDMHAKDARAEGESEQRLYALSAWRETPFFSARERAALTWTELLTEISTHEVSDVDYDTARQHFSEKELVDLTLAIVAINGWNRFGIAFGAVPGTYQRK